MKHLLLIITCILISSCQNTKSNQSSNDGIYVPNNALEYGEDMEMEAPRSSEQSAPPFLNSSIEKGSKIIKIGSINFEVTKLEKAKTNIDSLIQSVNGYYENELYQAHGNRVTYVLKIRIPNVKFDSLITALENGVGELKSKNISAQDVTEEFVDLNIRLANNLAYLKQYQTILLKAKTIKEILEVQEKIRTIEEEIDSKKGRLKYLEDNVMYSTLNLEISELITRELSNQPNFGRKLVNAFNNGVQFFLSFVVTIVNFWPFFLIVGFFLFARKAVWSGLKRFGSNLKNKKGKVD